MQLPNGNYLHGLVVRANVSPPQAPMPGANLIYIFEHQSESARPDPAVLKPSGLLLPPIWTNALAWSRGYFMNVDFIDVSPSRLLPKHCFWRASAKRYVDDGGEGIGDRIEPCGQWELVSYRWIDDQVSDAVGIARVPVD